MHAHMLAAHASVYSASSPCMRSRPNSTVRAWCNRLSPAGVRRTPRLRRCSSGVSTAASSSESRLLTADAAMNSRCAARAMLPSSHTATNSCSEVRSMRRAKLRSLDGMADGFQASRSDE